MEKFTGNFEVDFLTIKFIKAFQMLTEPLESSKIIS